jgi:hypothetical protein
MTCGVEKGRPAKCRERGQIDGKRVAGHCPGIFGAAYGALAGRFGRSSTAIRGATARAGPQARGRWPRRVFCKSLDVR